MRNYMAKFTAALLALTVLSGNTFFARAEADASASAEQVYQANYDYCENEVLMQLGILADYLDGEQHTDSNVTRAELAYSVCKLFNLPIAAPDTESYSDINTEYWAFKEIETVTANRLMNGTGDGKFSPDDYATYGQILKVVLYGMGYEPIIKNYDTVQAGLLDSAKKSGIGIIKNAGLDSSIDNSMLVDILYNALGAKCVMTELTDKENYYISKNDTVMSVFWDMEKYSDVMTGNQYTAFDVPYTSADNSYMFGTRKVRCDDDRFNAYLGMNVEYYISNDKKSDEKLLCVVPSSNDVVSIESMDFLDKSKNRLTYYVDGNKKSLLLDDVYTVIYNNKAISSYSDDLFDIDYGNIRLVDNNGNGKYDVVFIEDEKSCVAGKVNNGDRITIGDLIDKKNLIDIPRGGDVLCRMSDGTPADITDITTGDVLSIRQDKSKYLTEIIINRQSVSGTLTYVGNNKVGIQDTEYDALPSVTEKVSSLLDSQTVIAYIDYHGYVVGVEQGDAADFQIGYLIAVKSTGLDKVSANIVLPDNQVKAYEFSKKVTIDEEKFNKGASILNRLSERQLIRFKLDSSDNICLIDTYVLGNGENANSLHKTYTRQMDSVRRYTGGGSVFGGRIPYDTRTVFFIVPASASTDEELYTAVDVSEISLDVYFTCEAYSSDEYSKNTSAILIYGSYDDCVKLSAQSKFGIVSSHRKTVDANGNDVDSLGIELNGTKLNVTCDNAELVKDIDVGDYIQFVCNSKNEIRVKPEVCWSRKNGMTANPFYDTDLASPASRKCFMYGRLYSVDDSILRVVIDEGTEMSDAQFADFNFVTVNATTKYYSIDSKDNITNCGISDLKPFFEYGNGASKIFIHSSYGVAKNIYIIED